MKQQEIVPRVFGHEVEYGAIRPQDLNPFMGELSKFSGLEAYGEFLENGSRLYFESADIPEYATAECVSLDDLVAQDIVGEQIVWEACQNLGTHLGQTTQPGYEIQALQRRTSTPDGKSTGTHDNYSTTVNVWTVDKTGERMFKIMALATQFATRTILSGSGRVHDGQFQIGQKVHHLEQLFGTVTTSKKPLVNLRNKPYTHLTPDNGRFFRLHVTCGDANISPWATRMKFGTTSLMLRLLEHEMPIEELLLAHPLSAAKKVGREPANMTVPLLLANGKTASALDIQEALAEQALILSEKIDLPEQEVSVGHEWILAIDALRRYSNGQNHPILRNLDWFTKQEALQRKQERKGRTLTQDEMRDYDLAYDRMPGGIGYQWRSRGRFDHTPSPEALETAYTKAPNTRAALRGAVIVVLARRHRENPDLRLPPQHPIGWNFVVAETLQGNSQVCGLGSAHAEPTTESLDRVLRKLQIV